MSGREILICVNQGVVLERQAAAVEDAGWCCLREMTSQPKETVLPMVQVGALCCRNQQERLPAAPQQEVQGGTSHKWTGETKWVSGATGRMSVLLLTDGAMVGC